MKVYQIILLSIMLLLFSCNKESSNPTSSSIDNPSVSLPELSSPANNSIDVSLSPKIIWNSFGRNCTYALQISVDESFTNYSVNINNITDTSYQVSDLISNKVYYWQIKATDTSGVTTTSNCWSFKTKVLSKPILVLPENSAKDISLTSTLKWENYPEAKSYRIQVSDNTLFSNLIIDKDSINNTNYVLSGLESEKKYYWRIKALLKNETTEYSDIWNFTTASVPNEVTSFNYSYSKNEIVKSCTYFSFNEKYMVVQCDVYNSYFQWTSNDSRVKGVLIGQSDFKPENGIRYNSTSIIWVSNQQNGSIDAGEILVPSQKFTVYTFDKNLVYSKGVVYEVFVPERYCYSGYSNRCGL